MAPKKFSRDELNEMTKEDLVDLADKNNLDVTRADGEEGEPLKEDYVNALAQSSVGASGQNAKIGSAKASSIDTTIPGGKYVNARGQTVNAEGQLIDEDGTLLEEEQS